MGEIVAPALLFLVAAELCALAFWPLAWRLFGGLPDRGYAASKALGPLLLAYAVWLPSMLGWLALARGTLIVVLTLAAIACWWRWSAGTAAWAQVERDTVVRTEAVFVGLFVLGTLVRVFNAAVLGQEKFMDMALLNAFASGERLPAEDPWLAGYGVPYYHFSYLLLAALGKLAGLPAAYIYPLAVVFVFAAAGTLAAALATSLAQLLSRPGQPVRPLIPTLFGAFFVMLAGNLEAPLELLAARGIGSPEFWQTVGVRNLSAANPPRGLLPADSIWWFHASRVIPTIKPDGISEFPYFSFLLGDLHPHYTALPLDLLALTLALTLLLRGPGGSLLYPGVAALALGALLVANTWDVPAFWGIYAACGLLAAWRLPAWERRGALARLGATLITAFALYAPYFIGSSSPPLGLGVVDERTPLVSLLILFGAPLALLALGLRWLWQLGYGAHGLAELRRIAVGRTWVLALLPLLALVALAALREGTLVLLLLFALALVPLGVGLLAGRDEPDPTRLAALRFTWLLAAMAIALLLGVELFYLSDVFASRMNTVFKVHYNVWLLLGLATAALCSALLVGVELPRRNNLLVPTARAGVALALGLVYPLAATYTKSDGFRVRPTLNGAAFLATSRPGDAAVIEWLRLNAPGRPVVLEAVGGDYSEYGRISTFAGLPTVLGWVGHELQWRGPLAEFTSRRDDVQRAYTASDRADVADVLRRYRVRFVVVGDLEREAYGQDVEAHFAGWLPIAFQSGSTTLYRVPVDSDLAAPAAGGATR